MPQVVATLSSNTTPSWNVADGQSGAQWRSLLARSDPATAIFRSPDYVAYLRDIGRHVDLLTADHGSGPALSGLVPIQSSTAVMPFSIRGRTIAEIRLKSALVLGSEPMIRTTTAAQTADALDALFQTVADRYSDAAVIDLPTIPVPDGFWTYLATSPIVDCLFYRHVLHGVRDFHSVAVPASVAEYDDRLPRKRRYNFSRQERLLHQYLGHRLSLRLIDDEAGLPDLLGGLESLGIRLDRRSMMTERHYRAAARHGLLRCFLLTAGPEVVAIANGIAAARTYHLDRLHHRQSLARFSPGTTLWQSVLRFLIEEGGIDTVVMGFSNPAYRHRATNAVEQRARVLLFRRTAANWLSIVTHARYTAVVNAVRDRLERRF